MEILGTNIPNLQNAIASGLDSVTAGVIETTKASGVASLGIAQESFSFELVGGSAELPAVSDAAEYPEPSEYFQSFSGVESDSPISMLDVARTLTDRQFSADRSLTTFADEAVGQLREGMENSFQLEGSFGGTTSDASDRSIIVVGGKESLASDRSIIVVGGKVSDASDRSIIVVGGKTYFQTIDDSLNQSYQNPTQETADLFRQQFGAVQDMITTVDQTVELQKSLFSRLNKQTIRDFGSARGVVATHGCLPIPVMTDPWRRDQ